MRINRLLSAVALTAVVGTGLVAAPSDAGATPTRSERAGSRYTVSIELSRNKVDVNHKVVISGKVKPASKGITVVIQKKLDGKSWKQEARLKTSGIGRYSYTDKPSTPGSREYRAVVPGTGAHAKGTSKSVGLLVYRWLDLTKVRSRSQSGYTYRADSVSINGIDFGPAMRGDYYGGNADEGFVDWNLDRACTEMTTRIGNSDESDDAATANIQIVKDGTAAYTKSYGLTESEKKTFNLKDVFRLKFAWTSTNPDGTVMDQSGASPVLVAPKVHCAF